MKMITDLNDLQKKKKKKKTAHTHYLQNSIIITMTVTKSWKPYPHVNKTNIWFDLFDLQSPQLVEHSCSARMRLK